MMAAQNGDTITVKFLLEDGADVNSMDNSGIYIFVSLVYYFINYFIYLSIYLNMYLTTFIFPVNFVSCF